MLPSEIAQKNNRVRFWNETITSGALKAAQRKEMTDLLVKFKGILLLFSQSGSISEEDSLSLRDLERKLEQLAESARLESGKSELL